MKISMRVEQQALPINLRVKLQRYRTNQRRRVDRHNRSQFKLFKWDLFALPIRCKTQTASPRSNHAVRFEDLMLSPIRLLLLTGSPGSGKSTACRRFRAFPPRGVVPINVSKIKSLTVESLRKTLAEVLK